VINYFLRELFGLPVYDDKLMVASASNGISQWELDMLVRRYTFSHMQSSVATLKSLSKLVTNLTNMVVLDNIATLCSTALDSLEKADEALKYQKYENALEEAREAAVASEKAFFDPNMVSLLYFPDEHKYAIYALPFVPIIFQLLSGNFTSLIMLTFQESIRNGRREDKLKSRLINVQCKKEFIIIKNLKLNCFFLVFFYIHCTIYTRLSLLHIIYRSTEKCAIVNKGVPTGSRRFEMEQLTGISCLFLPKRRVFN
jgi:hypothetical protein